MLLQESYALQYKKKLAKDCLNLLKTAAEAVLVLEIAAKLLNQANLHFLVPQAVNPRVAKVLPHILLNLENYQEAQAD